MVSPVKLDSSISRSTACERERERCNVSREVSKAGLGLGLGTRLVQLALSYTIGLKLFTGAIQLVVYLEVRQTVWF